jgi:hypothetical protein
MFTKRAALMVCLLAGTACASATAGRGATEEMFGGEVMTRAEIVESGARDAFEALKRGRFHLTIQDTGANNRPRVTQRGVGSIILSPELAVVIDGTRVNDPIGALRQIPARTIRRIHVLSAREAMPAFGASGGNGVIVVLTGA